jgi:hypothetical protein
VDGLDRSPGKGVGHVLVLDRRGNLIRDVVLGEGDIYHPGGIDFDGRTVWVPVAEYRPGSRSIVYALDPASLVAREAFRVDDHIGGVVRDPRTGRVHGVSWGSRTEYTWTAQGRELDARANPSHLVDYQDCAYVAVGKQLCSGVTDLPGPAAPPTSWAGLALKDLPGRPDPARGPLPVLLRRRALRPPQPGGAGDRPAPVLRLFAGPDDGEEVAGTELLVYEDPDPRA